MATKHVKQHNKVRGNQASAKASVITDALLAKAVYLSVATEQIDFSPFNYRKHFSESALEQFAAELKQHGIIAPLLLRQVQPKRYELIAGERRLRAAKIAELATVPAAIVTLSDEEVIEIQLAENLQREDPHPLHEAAAIGKLQSTGKTMEEIAARLGRSKQFIYSRLKLLQLIDAFQEMLYAEVITLKDALEIATLSAESQTDLFTGHAANWKKQKGFQFANLSYYISQYRYNLKEAPFNIKDKNLLPAAGACTTCIHNSATLKTLFPDQAKQAVCSKKSCYNDKCHAYFMLELTNQLLAYQPVAFLSFNELPEYAMLLRGKMPEIADLPVHAYYEVARINKPKPPNEERYTYENEEGEPELDSEEWAEANAEYEAELQEYEVLISTGAYKVGLLVGDDQIEPVYFSLDQPKRSQQPPAIVSAKQVQEALRTGTATPELLRAEMTRITEREHRAEELDAEKIQLAVHELFSNHTREPEKIGELTEADQLALRLIVYQTLSFDGEVAVNELLFPNKERYERAGGKALYTALQSLTDQQVAWMIRMALMDKPESKQPAQASGYFLYEVAKAAGLPIATVEQAQRDKANERKERLGVRLTAIESKIKKMEAGTLIEVLSTDGDEQTDDFSV